ncbi:transcriptional regulator [Bifidobacterium subtile]|uniref:transcriptional regulator n=1 Tax=Bifidobacterium subtile TaxID=77635 RepID=UPI002F35AF46
MKPSVTPRFDQIIHEPMRLRICGLLTGMPEMQFAVIRETLGLSDAMCSRHLKILSDCGYVKLSKRRGESNRHMITWASLTSAGREALEAHLAALQAIASGETRDNRKLQRGTGT